MIGELLVSTALSVLTAFGLLGGDMTQADLGEYTPPAVITYVETSAQQQGNELIFGNLVMELPEGVTAEVKASVDAEEGQKIRLNGAQRTAEDSDSSWDIGPFPPQISIARYTVEYEYKETLMSALLDWFSYGYLEVWYYDLENSEYVLSWECDKYMYEHYFILVHGEDLYIVCEFDRESAYSFFALREQGKVRWQGSSGSLSKRWHSDKSYFKVSPKDNKSFLCYYSDNDLYLYLDGYFDSYYASYEAGKRKRISDSQLMDINFDGCIDICLDNYCAL